MDNQHNNMGSGNGGLASSRHRDSGSGSMLQANTDTSPSDQVPQQIPLPQYFLVRPGETRHTASGIITKPGPIVPLVAVDQLPEWLDLLGVPRELGVEQTVGLTNLGTVARNPEFYQVYIHSSVDNRQQHQHQSSTSASTPATSMPSSSSSSKTSSPLMSLSEMTLSSRMDPGARSFTTSSDENTVGSGHNVTTAANNSGSGSSSNNTTTQARTTNGQSQAPSTTMGLLPQHPPPPVAGSTAAAPNPYTMGNPYLQSQPPPPPQGPYQPMLPTASSASRATDRLLHAYQTQPPAASRPNPHSKPAASSTSVRRNGISGASSTNTATNPNPNLNTTNTNSSMPTNHSGGGGGGTHQTIPGNPASIYCRHWCHKGTCQWGARCRYEHAMPGTRDGLAEVGLPGFPAWFNAAMAMNSLHHPSPAYTAYARYQHGGVGVGGGGGLGKKMMQREREKGRDKEREREREREREKKDSPAKAKGKSPEKKGGGRSPGGAGASRASPSRQGTGAGQLPAREVSLIDQAAAPGIQGQKVEQPPAPLALPAPQEQKLVEI